MPILVIGGSGFIGTRVIRRLAARGEEVAVIARPVDHYPTPLPRGIPVASQAAGIPLIQGWDGHLSTIGRVIWEGYGALCKMVCMAGLNPASSAIAFPVFVLRSKRGKLLLETSTRI